MKLKLSSQDGISILTGDGALSERDLKVLKAGLTHLFKTGKNRIILHFAQADQIPPLVLREISQYDLLARELSGRIILSGVSSKLKEQIQRFAQPPVIECFETLVEALAYFKNQKTPLDPPKTLTPEEVLQEKEKIKQGEISQNKDIRVRIVELENENQLLKEQLSKMILERRTPPNEDAYKSRIEILEKQIEELVKPYEVKATQA